MGGCFSSWGRLKRADFHLEFNACRWLPLAWARPCAAEAVELGLRIRYRLQRASPPLLLASSAPSSDMGKQLHGSSQVPGVFKLEANEISLLPACPYPAFLPARNKSKSAVSVQNTGTVFALSSKAGAGEKKTPNQTQAPTIRAFNYLFMRV